MKTRQGAAKDIDQYIAGFPPGVRVILERIRETIKHAAPGAKETIKYGMPTFTLEGNRVHFAAFKNHIGLFPPVKGDAAFRKAAMAWRGPTGNLRFPLDVPIPYSLIARAVKLRVKEIQARSRKKSSVR